MSDQYKIPKDGLVAMTLADIPNLVASVRNNAPYPKYTGSETPGNTLPPLLSSVVNVNYDAKSLLQHAILNKDITEEMAEELLVQYENDPLKLSGLLNDFARMRVNYLMEMDWTEFDRGGYGEELAAKNLTRYKLKKYLQFGKRTNGVIDNASFLKFAIDNGYIETNCEWNYEETASNTREVIYNKIYNQIISFADCLLNKSWDELSEQELTRLKQEAFPSYKKKYLEKFGIQYTEPF
jgi:hypothetical protein